MYNFLNKNRLIYKCQFDLQTIISQIVEQSDLTFIDCNEKSNYKQKLFRERVYHHNPNISIQQIHINYIDKLLKDHE